MTTLIRKSLMRLQEEQHTKKPRPALMALIALSVILGLLLLMSGSVAYAQATGSATLRGTVKDQAGAVVTKATVVLINEATKVERKATSNENGAFVFSAVNPASYTIK